MEEGQLPPLQGRAGFVRKGRGCEKKDETEVWGRHLQRQVPGPNVAQDRAPCVVLELVRPCRASQTASACVGVILVPAGRKDPVEQHANAGRVDPRLNVPAKRAQPTMDRPGHTGGQTGQVPPLEFVPEAAFQRHVVRRGESRRRRSPLEAFADAELDRARPRAGAPSVRRCSMMPTVTPRVARLRLVARRVLQCAASSQSPKASRRAWKGVSRRARSSAA